MRPKVACSHKPEAASACECTLRMMISFPYHPSMRLNYVLRTSLETAAVAETTWGLCGGTVVPPRVVLEVLWISPPLAILRHNRLTGY